MSDAAATLARPDAVRTARVWQATDLLHPGAPAQGFVRQSWKTGAPAIFGLQSVRTWPEAIPDQAADDTLPELTDDAGPDINAVQGEVTTAVSQEALETLRQEALAEGVAAGRSQMQAEMDALQATEHVRSQQLLSELDRSIRQLLDTPERVFEPLKRLALHLAEQLVLAELSLSASAIERLVQRCVDELAPQRNTPVLVELHPSDLNLLYALMQQSSAERSADAATVGPDGATWAAWQLQAKDDLLPGSVRVSAHDSVVSDLIENRLEALARQLLLDPVRGMAQSAFQPDRLAQRLPGSRQVADAQPRMAAERRAKPDTFDADPIDD